MKPEEAIDILKDLWGFQKSERYAEKQIRDALELAIKALKEKPHGECRTCKHYTKGGLDGKTYVCEHPSIDQDDYFNYAFLTMDENDFCSCYENYKSKEGEQNV